MGSALAGETGPIAVGIAAPRFSTPATLRAPLIEGRRPSPPRIPDALLVAALVTLVVGRQPLHIRPPRPGLGKRLCPSKEGEHQGDEDRREVSHGPPSIVQAAGHRREAPIRPDPAELSRILSSAGVTRTRAILARCHR